MIINDLFNNKKPGVEEAKKKKKSSRSMGGYFFPGYGYYGSGESGEGGGDGGGESANRGMAEASLGDYRKKAQLSRAMAQTNKFFDRDDPEAVARADQTMAKRERGMARADARVKPYIPPKFDAEKHQRDLTAKYPNIDELVADAEQRRDPNYDRAEGNAYYDGREAEQNYQKLKQIQRVIQGLNESQAPFKKNYLYEGLDRDGLQTVKLWESAGQHIVEAQLTVDQINQLFKSAEQDATAAGGNRTMLGKGKDAAMAVNQAWETLKDKVATSGPIKSMDAAYDTAADKLKQATGGDQGVMKYVQKYRDFAKANPVAQSLIYSALIAAAGISGAGLGGAAALGLFKLVDKLLQGDKFSSAAYAGAKTGALAYGASKVADYFKGPQTPQGAGGDQIPGGGQITDPNAPDYNAGYAEYQRDIADVRGYDNYMTKNPTSSLSPEQYADKIGDPELMSNTKMMNDLASKMGLPPGAHQATFQGGVPVTIDGKAVPLDLLTGDQQRNIEAARTMRQAMSGSQSLAQKAAAMAAAPDKAYESREFHTSHKLTDADLYFLFSAATQLNEGVLDSIKGTVSKYAGKAADYAKTQGTNLTTKVTADKLKTAWLKADSPTDSDQVYNVMTQAGVAPQILDTVYKTMNIPTFKEKALARPTTPAVSNTPVPAGPVPRSAAPTAPNSATPGDSTGTTAIPQSPEDVRKSKQSAAALSAQQAMGDVVSPGRSTPAATAIPKQSTSTGSTSAIASGPPGFNAGNLAQLPGMAQYMKPQAKATPNYSDSKGYGKTTMTVNPMQAKTAASTAPTAKSAPAAKPVAPTTTPAPKKEPITIGGQKITPNDPAYDKIMKNAPTATTSKPAVSPLRGSDPRFPNGKYDGVTGQPTPEWQAELAKQNAAKQAATTTTSATARPPVTTTTRPTAVPKTDAEMDAVEKVQIEKMKAKNPNLARLMALDDELAESLTWSRNFDPGRSLYRQMKKES